MTRRRTAVSGQPLPRSHSVGSPLPSDRAAASSPGAPADRAVHALDVVTDLFDDDAGAARRRTLAMHVAACAAPVEPEVQPRVLAVMEGRGSGEDIAAVVAALGLPAGYLVDDELTRGVDSETTLLLLTKAVRLRGIMQFFACRRFVVEQSAVAQRIREHRIVLKLEVDDSDAGDVAVFDPRSVSTSWLFTAHAPEPAPGDRQSQNSTSPADTFASSRQTYSPNKGGPERGRRWWHRIVRPFS